MMSVTGVEEDLHQACVVDREKLAGLSALARVFQSKAYI